MPERALMIGTAEVEITPPVGTQLAGGLTPRPSVGVEDPLYAKAIVIESGGVKLAYIVLDLSFLLRRHGDRAAELASGCTGIAADHIVWSVTHTHTGPYTAHFFGGEQEGVIDEAWLEGIPEKFAECVARADAARVPARMSRLRGFEPCLAHNRRLTFKDGRAINTWNLGSADDDVQCVGSAGPLDPELGILAFDDLKGNLLSVLFHFTLHANTNFGARFSGDYPAVVASRMREQFGPDVSTLFLNGACADLNCCGQRHTGAGNILADRIIERLKHRKPTEEAVPVGSMKREVTVPFRDFTVDQEERIKMSGWSPEGQEVFRKELEFMRSAGDTEAKTILQAWHIGDVGFASLPGELFVEWGLKIKRDSPFPWTYPVELGGDYQGYLVTQQAWEAGGYESLISRVAKPSHQGVAQMVDEALDMLKALYTEGHRR